MNIGLILLCAAVAGVGGLQMREETGQLEMNDAVPYDQNAVGYDCSSVHFPALQAVCDLCSASAAYAVYHGAVAHLTGLYTAEVEMLERAIAPVQDQLPQANYTLAFNGDRVCLAAYEVEGRPNFQRVFRQFSSIAEGEIAVPEVFSRQAQAELDYIAVRTFDRLDEKYQYEGLTIGYRIEDSVEVGRNLTLNLEAMTLRVEGDSASVVYTGLAALDQSLHSFSLQSPYDRQTHAPFVVSITPSEEVSAIKWAEAAALGTQCREVVDIPSISPLSEQSFSLLNLLYRYNPATSAMDLWDISGFFPLPDVSILPHLTLTAVTGQYRLRLSAQSCEVLLAGDADYTFPMQLSLIADAKGWAVFGGLETDGITVREVEDSFYQDFFGGESMLPVFDPEVNQDIIAQFRDLELTHVAVRFQPDPALSLSISGEVSWGSSTVSGEVVIGWVEGVVESVMVLSSSDSPLPSDPTLTVVSSELVISTADIDLKEFAYMRGVVNEGSVYWTMGIYGKVVLQGSTQCGDSEFCSVLAASTQSPSIFVLQGTAIGDILQLRTALPDISLSHGYQYEEAELVLEMSPTETLLYVAGALRISVSANSVVRFAGRITDREGTALLRVTSEEAMISQWTGLELGRGELRGFVDTQGLRQTVMKSRGRIGDCGDGECVEGTLEATIDPHTLASNSSVFRTANLSPRLFITDLLGLPSDYTVPLALQGLDMTQSLDVRVLPGTEETIVSGPVQYFGVSGWMEAALERVGGEYAFVQVILDEFYIGNHNLWLRASGFSPLLLELTVDPSFQVTATLTGTVQFWDFSSPIYLRITDAGLTASFAGTTAGSEYLVDFQLRAGDFDSFATVNATVLGSISVDQLRAEEIAVRSDVLFWIQQSLDALAMVAGWKDNATLAVAMSQRETCPDSFCPILYNCISPPTVSCKEYATEQVCTESKTSCVNQEQVCTRQESICIMQGRKCSSYDDTGYCVNYEETCEEYITVCQEWSWQCKEKAETTCTTYEVRTLPDVCVEYESTCEMHSYADTACLARCQQSLNSLLEEEEIEGKLIDLYEWTWPMVSGFTSMVARVPDEQYRSDLFYLTSFSFLSTTQNSGLSHSDLLCTVSFSTFSAITNQEIESTEEVRWSLGVRELNERELFRAVKRVLVENDDGMISDELVQSTAFELILSHLTSLSN